MDKTTLIFKVLSGEASEHELAELDNWTAQSDANKSEYENLKLHWDITGSIHQVNPAHFYDGLVKIKARIKEKNAIRKQKRTIIWIGIIMTTVLFTTALFTISNPAPYPVLRFDSAPLSEVISKLEREFHIDIKTDPGILACRLTGTFYKKGDQQGVIRSVSAALKLNYEILSDNVYHLSGSGCEPGKPE